MSYPPGQQPPTWGPGQQPPAWGPGQQPPAWGPPAGQPGAPPPPGWQPPYLAVQPSAAGTNPLLIILIFGVALGVVVVIAAIAILLSQPPVPQPPCQPGQPCAPQRSLPPISLATAVPTPTSAASLPSTTPAGVPTAPATPAATGLPTAPPGTPEPGATPAPTATPQSDSPPVILGGSSWRSGTLGYGFEFDGSQLLLTRSTETLAVLDVIGLNAQIVVEAASGDTTPAELMAAELDIVDTFMVGRTLDSDDYDAVLGPSIGYVNGEAGVFSGILLSSDGTPTTPGGVTVVTATDGRITVAVIVLVGEPDQVLGTDTAQLLVRDVADDIVKSFDWGTVP